MLPCMALHAHQTGSFEPEVRCDVVYSLFYLSRCCACTQPVYS